MKKISFIALFLIAVSACKKKGPDNTDEIPYIPVNVSINTTLPDYIGLQGIGNFVYVNGGFKGLYVFHNYSDEYVAYDRACAYRPYDSCAIVSVDTAQLTIKCACCQSQYTMDGILKQGPSQRSMRQYNCQKSGDWLYISN